MSKAADVRLLYVRELRSALRERSIVVNSILLPIFLYPLLLWLAYTGVSFVAGQTEGFRSRAMLKGLPQEHQFLKIQLGRDDQVELRESGDPVGDLQSGKLDVLAEFLPAAPEAHPLKANLRIRLTYDNSKDRSTIARDRLAERLRRYRDLQLEVEAKKLGISPAQMQQFWVDSRNVATRRQMGRFLLGLMLPAFLVIMLGIGCIHPAIDCTAGEREKSTWETLMTAATSRSNIVAAKYLYVATMASLAAILNVSAMVFSMRAVLSPLLRDVTQEFSFQIPMGSVPLILLLTVLLALFVSAGMMILASFARTFKEGQSMVGPLYVALVLPIMFLQVPGLELTPGLSLIPIVNVIMVFREAVAGIYRWPLIGITLGVEVACIMLALWLATFVLRYEDFIIGSYGGSLGKFLKERLLGRKRSPVALSQLK